MRHTLLKIISDITCCFIGHRTIEVDEAFIDRLRVLIKNLIVGEGVNTFLFGSKSQFNSLCRDVVDELKIKFPHIKRVYVRAEFPFIDETYKNYLLESYDETYFPKEVLGAGRNSYVKRNQVMIDKSDFCVFYYKETYSLPSKRQGKRTLTFLSPQSGTKQALNYAKHKNKEIIVVSPQ